MCGLEQDDVRGLRALLAVDDVELHLLTFLQVAEAVGLDGAVVDEDVLTALHGDEAVALLRVEPLHGAGNHVACYSSLPERTDNGVLRRLTCRAERSMWPRAMSID